MTVESLEYEKRGNLLLNALPKTERERLQPHLEQVEFVRGDVLSNAGCKIGHVWFPIDVLISLLAVLTTGKEVEVGIAGSEGIVGYTSLLRGNYMIYHAVAQMPGRAWRVKTSVMAEELKQSETWRELLMSFTHNLLVQVSQSAICNRFHSNEERLCRWLLTVQDRTGREELPLTQEMISQMTGMARPSASAIATKLQRAGIIQYSPGLIQILDRPAMIASACECYQIINDEFNDLINDYSARVSCA
jgi:CRP-like cAMP-binding protein